MNLWYERGSVETQVANRVTVLCKPPFRLPSAIIRPMGLFTCSCACNNGRMAGKRF